MSRHQNLDPLPRPLPQDESQWNALEAVFFDRSGILKKLIDQKADLGATFTGGTKLVYMAAKKGHAKCLRLLIDAGEDFTSPDRDGWTPVTAAVSEGHAACLQILKDAGADLSHVDTTGRTPANLAAFLNRPGCLKMLADAGADITTPDRRGITPMLATRGHGPEECSGILMNAVRARGRTASAIEDCESANEEDGSSPAPR